MAAIAEMAQLNSKIEELTRLNESEYDTTKSVTILQYFDKVYTLAQGSIHFQNLIDTLIQKKYAKLCYPVLKHTCTEVFKTQERWHTTYYLLHSLWNYTDKSTAMCSAVVDAQFVPLLMHNLNQEAFFKHFSSNEALKKLFDMTVSILHNIAQVPELVSELRRHQCLETLNRVIQMIGSNSAFVKGLAFLTLAYIIREDERTYLSNANDAIPYLVKLLNEAISTSDRRSQGLEARELCKGLSKLSVCDDNKRKIFSESILTVSLLNMLQQHNNPVEQSAACTLIWNLSFDEMIRSKYLENKALNVILSTLAQSSSNDELRRLASGCLCTLMGGPTPPSRRSASSPTVPSKKNLMISYNHDMKQLSKQIKDQLAADGYDVWIDVEHMHGNLLDSMSEAIEGASIFLMCLTEKYKDSPSCRLECEYALQRKKPIIPLLLQANYKPDGWLGMVLGAKLYVNYAKKPFDVAYSETISELQAVLNTRPERPERTTSSTVKKATPLPSPPRPASSNETSTNPPGALVHLMSQIRIGRAPEPMPVSSGTLETMSMIDTQQLLAAYGLEKFMPIFVDMDGSKLAKLFEIKKKAPQCYYMLIKDKWDQMNQAKERRDSASPVRLGSSPSSMAQFLQLTIVLDKLADCLTS